ncbi:pex19 family protein [Phlyctema vagabunda]|uniref:Pex19 family protein n=1 Tax=Phlyctema vagabunda TaxID=108571 RepID=A0ABR4PMB7_9HELO
MTTKPEDTTGPGTSTKIPADSTTAAISQPQESEPSAVDDVPDPDEDDLDDLDDMLDEFSATKLEESKATAPSASTTARKPQLPAEEVEGISDDDFAKQLQAGMADLLGELETSPDMQAQFESMLKELGGAAGLGEAAAAASAGASVGANAGGSAGPAGPAKPAAGPSAAKAAPGEESFQETIKKTMERMQASGDKATQAATEDDTNDLLAEMMKAMQSGALGEDGTEEDFSKMLLGMMEQLTNKEILYEPMKELDDKFPAWMEKNQASTAKEDLDRYKEQQKVVSEIVKKFEEKTYKDENAADREYIVERMQKMQAAGSPPADLVGDMAAAQEAFGAPEEGCPQQ